MNKVIWSIFLLLTLISVVHGQKQQAVIRFGIIADPQYADTDPEGTRFYRNSLDKLKTAVTDFNQQQVPFLINLGDVTDRNPRDLDTVLSVINQFSGKVYTIPGNHDYKNITDNGVLYKKLGMPAPYYSFKKGNWRFIMLNTNEIAAYSNVKNTDNERELREMMTNIKVAGRKNGYDYNGGISQKQLVWLKKELEKADRKNDNVLIFSHHPLGCAPGLTALNDQEIMSVITPFKCVKGVIAGHHHPGAFCEIGTIPCIVLQGMVETKDQNSYGVIELYPDKFVLKGQGRMLSKTINFKSH